jgi:hypothetical protein
MKKYLCIEDKIVNVNNFDIQIFKDKVYFEGDLTKRFSSLFIEVDISTEISKEEILIDNSSNVEISKEEILIDNGSNVEVVKEEILIDNGSNVEVVKEEEVFKRDRRSRKGK